MTEEEAEESMLVSSFKHEDNEDEFAGRGVGDEINEEQSVDDISMDSMEDEGTSEEDGAQDVDTGEHIE